MLCLWLLVVKFATDTSLMAKYAIMQLRKWRHVEITPSHGVSFWVSCASGNVLFYSFSLYLCTLQLQSKTELTGDGAKCRYFLKTSSVCCEARWWEDDLKRKGSQKKSKSFVFCQRPTKNYIMVRSFF